MPIVISRTGAVAVPTPVLTPAERDRLAAGILRHYIKTNPERAREVLDADTKGARS